MAANTDVCFVGATNLPQLLDNAVMRPGRFDQLVHVPLPTADERVDIFARRLAPLLLALLTGRDASRTAAERVALARALVDDAGGAEFAAEVVASTAGMSGADLTAVVRSVATAIAVEGPMMAGTAALVVEGREPGMPAEDAVALVRRHTAAALDSTSLARAVAAREPGVGGGRSGPGATRSAVELAAFIAKHDPDAARDG